VFVEAPLAPLPSLPLNLISFLCKVSFYARNQSLLVQQKKPFCDCTNDINIGSSSTPQLRMKSITGRCASGYHRHCQVGRTNPNPDLWRRCGRTHWYGVPRLQFKGDRNWIFRCSLLLSGSIWQSIVLAVHESKRNPQ
jgi:hypothetical protein